MPQPSILAVAQPQASRLGQALPQIHYADAYALLLAEWHPPQAPELTQLLFGRGPAWVGRLLQLRDWLVRPFGLTTLPPSHRPPRGIYPVAGGQLGLFRVFSVTPEEVIMGLDDHHLNFRVAVTVVAEAGPRRAVVSTAVQFHNRLGRVYFALIRPFHQLIVKALLRQARRPPSGRPEPFSSFPAAAPPTA